MEYGHGYSIIGILLFIIAIVLLSRIKIDRTPNIKPKFYAIVGLSIIIFVMTYNYITKDPIATLDSMTFLLGGSLIARSLNNEQARKVGTFGTYLSFSFILLYYTFYVIFSEFVYEFDHYFVMLPSAYIIKAIGIPLDIVTTETIRIYGTRELTVKIGGPCSGLYSMFLLISIVIGYSITENIRDMKKIIGMTIIAALVAYTANLFRVSIIYVIGYSYGYDAMMTVHVHLGWMLFAITSITIIYILSKIEPTLRVT